MEQKKRVWFGFADFSGQKHPRDVSSQIVSQWILSLADRGLSNKTINNQLGVLKAIYSVLDPHTRIFERIKKRPVVANGMREFTCNQVLKIFDAVDGAMQLTVPHRDEMKLLFRLAAFTGLRLKDCCLFTWDSVNFSRNLINCTPWKTCKSSGAAIWIRIHPDLHHQLRLASQWRKNQYVLPEMAAWYTHDRTRPDRMCRRIIAWALWATPVAGRRPPRAEGYGFHSFRHTFASFCATAGVPEDYVKEILGHTSVSTTRYYVHLPSSVFDQVIAALPTEQKKV